MKTEKELVSLFEEQFNEKPNYIFSAPGRTELSGNHTDHQHGIVLAAAIDLEIKGVVSLNDLNKINIKSEGFDYFSIDLNDLEVKENEKGTTISLVRGIAKRIKELGKEIIGFNAYICSDVLQGSGLSSSAAFEVLIATIINNVSNCGLNPVDLAKISQYSENVYFGKPCGLMDQTASSVGNIVNIDFKDTENPIINKIDFDFSKCGYKLCVIDCGANHADLTEEYAAITKELKKVCECFNCNYLREINENDFYSNFNSVRKMVGDRAMLRAIHVYEENKRVMKQVEALKNNDFELYLKLTNESGDSSWEYLQNVVASGNKEKQELALALAMCKKILNRKGAFRVHGGGFAGTLQAFVKNEDIDEFKNEIEKYFGKDSCHILSIRKDGGTLEKKF